MEVRKRESALSKLMENAVFIDLLLGFSVSVVWKKNARASVSLILFGVEVIGFRLW